MFPLPIGRNKWEKINSEFVRVVHIPSVSLVPSTDTENRRKTDLLPKGDLAFYEEGVVFRREPLWGQPRSQGVSSSRPLERQRAGAG